MTSNRTVTTLGGVFTGLGLLFCSQSSNAVQLYFTMVAIGEYNPGANVCKHLAAATA